MNPKLLLSFTSLYFFAPLVGNLLNKANFNLDQKDKEQVFGYIKLGYINIWFLLLYITTVLIRVAKNIEWIKRVGFVSVAIIILILVWWTIAIASNKQLLSSTQWIQHKDMMAKSFIPWYNIYLWYKIHRFHQPYRWLKESLLRWGLYIILTIIDPTNITSIATITLILIRVSTLIAWIDLIPNTTKQQINKSFIQHPEELWSYVQAWWDYLFLKKKYTQRVKDLHNYYQQEKDMKWHQLVSYSILGIIIALLLFWSIRSYLTESSKIFDIIAYGLVATKYIVHVSLKKWPILPLIDSIIQPIMKLFFSTQKSKW